MPIIRNPFRKQDENARPPTAVSALEKPVNETQPVEIKEKKEPAEYKLSEINDSGVYLPPSPPERKSFWHTNSSRSTTSSAQRSLLNDNEPFNISRESFDSYRRSFDISARSPAIGPNEPQRGRQSLDSRTFLPPPRTSYTCNRPSVAPPIQSTPESDFEDVNIDDPKPPAAAPRKRGIFARLTESSSSSNEQQQQQTGADRPASSDGGKGWHHFGGRKRGQSGQGAELGNFPLKKEDSHVPKPESQLRNVEAAPPKQEVLKSSEALEAVELKSDPPVVDAKLPPPPPPPQPEALKSETTQAAAEVRVDS